LIERESLRLSIAIAHLSNDIRNCPPLRHEELPPPFGHGVG
jgi:hypothetical protein